MPDARPLNVRVAGALGWTGCLRTPSDAGQVWIGVDPAMPAQNPKHPEPWSFGKVPIPPYGHDSPEGWAVTGPLMVRFGLSAIEDGDVYIVGKYGGGWYQSCDVVCGLLYLPAEGPTILAAVAEWVVAYAETGRLPK